MWDSAVKFGFEIASVPGRRMYNIRPVLGTNLAVSEGSQVHPPYAVGKAKLLQAFFLEKFETMSSNTGTIGVEIRPIPYFKKNMFAEMALQLIPITAIGVIVVKAGSVAMDAANVLTEATGRYSMKFIANYNSSLYSTTDLVIESGSSRRLTVSMKVFSDALKEWFDKQNNKSHSLKTMFRGSSHPYFMNEDGSLAKYGSRARVPADVGLD